MAKPYFKSHFPDSAFQKSESDFYTRRYDISSMLAITKLLQMQMHSRTLCNENKLKIQCKQANSGKW